MQITVTGIESVESAAAQIGTFISGLRDKQPLLKEMGEYLLDEHDKAFQNSGHTEGIPWEQTDSWWAERMVGKQGTKPMIWTGAGRQSLTLKIGGGHIKLQILSYVWDFQFGNLQKVANYEMDSAENIYPAGSGMGRNVRRSINRHGREIFAVPLGTAEKFLGMIARLMPWYGGAR